MLGNNHDGDSENSSNTVSGIVSSTVDDNKTIYTSYKNEQVNFALDYPEMYSMTEPNENNVVIADGETTNFQVVVEYAYTTVGNSAIYSAEDLANQIEADSAVLTDWVGSTDVVLTSNQKIMAASMECYEYCFTLQTGEKDFVGQMLLFDGISDFGCYVYTSIINKNVSKAELYQTQNEAMKESLRIVGKHTPGDYHLYRYDELGLQFAIRDGFVGDTNVYADELAIYPVDGVYTESSIWLSKLYDKVPETGVETALENGCAYYLKKENAQYTTSPAQLNYGRYPCTDIELQYDEDGKRFTHMVSIIQTSDGWWEVSADTTATYYNSTVAAVTDFLFSIRFDRAADNAADESNTDSNTTVSSAIDDTAAMVSKIVTQIESSSTFIAQHGEKGITTDMNGDGIEEFLAIYAVENAKNQTDIMYELWTLPSTGAEQLQAGVLYTEVGGNSGAVGVVERYDNVRYLRTISSEGNRSSATKYNTLYEWFSSSKTLSDTGYYLEAHTSADDESKNRYILGDQTVDYDTYNQRVEEFTDYLYKVDMYSAPSDDVKSFEELG